MSLMSMGCRSICPSICSDIQNNDMVQLSNSYGESALNRHYVVMLTSTFGINHVLNEHENLGQFRPYVIPSLIMPFYSYPACTILGFSLKYLAELRGPKTRVQPDSPQPENAYGKSERLGLTWLLQWLLLRMLWNNMTHFADHGESIVYVRRRTTHYIVQPQVSIVPMYCLNLSHLQ